MVKGKCVLYLQLCQASEPRAVEATIEAMEQQDEQELLAEGEEEPMIRDIAGVFLFN